VTDATTEPDYLTPTEVAALLRVPVETVQCWCRRGNIAADKVGLRLWRIPRAAVEAIRRRNSPAVTMAPPEPARLRRDGVSATSRANLEYLRSLGVLK
jgi:excisionase family DNA binding protein